MSFPAPGEFAIRVSDLRDTATHTIDIRPGKDILRQLAQDMDLIELRKARLTGKLSPLGKHDWALVAEVGATVIQPCVATLVPVTTRLDTQIERNFLHDFPDEFEPEQEMPDDETSERLGQWIDPLAILAEALSLALPLYPRADDAGEVEVQVTEPGKQAMSDDDAKPFAALAGLKSKLENPESN